MPPISRLPDPVGEKTTWLYTATIKDETGAIVPGTALTSLKLTLFAMSTGNPIINSVSAVDILNTGRGTVDANGKLSILFTAADNPILDATQKSETHRMFLEWKYGPGGTKDGGREVEFRVVNFTKVA